MSPLCRELDVYHDELPRSAAMNMAVDEALLEHAVRPALRFYRWDHAAISFGYFGAFAEAEPYTFSHDVVRRWTGGGVVFHGQDLTYAIILPASFSVAKPSSLLVYTAVHEALRDALAQDGHRAELVATPSTVVSSACFARPVVADVLVGTRKVAGAAHRRTRSGLLHQGSIQGVKVGDQLAQGFASRLARKCEPQTLTGTVVKRAHQIAEAKYATAAWLRRR